MSGRLPGTLVLILLFAGLFIARTAWAGSQGGESNVLVRVSPLALLLANDVTIKVGDFTCQVVQGADPSSVCFNLPAGEYEVSATSDGYIVMPPTYSLHIAGNSQNSGGVEGSEFYFRLYQINNRLYMPTVQGFAVQPQR
jgi:hypothetical protein